MDKKQAGLLKTALLLLDSLNYGYAKVRGSNRIIDRSEALKILRAREFNLAIDPARRFGARVEAELVREIDNMEELNQARVAIDKEVMRIRESKRRKW